MTRPTDHEALILALNTLPTPTPASPQPREGAHTRKDR